MALYNNVIRRMNEEDSDEKRKLGTADPLNLRGGLQILGEKYQELPEDVRANVQEAGSMLGTAWEGAKTIDYKGPDPLGYVSDYAAWGVSHGLTKVGQAYSAVVEPVKKELSIRTGLDPIYWDAAEITADVLTPGIPLAKKSWAKIAKIIDTSPFKVPNPFKVSEFSSGIGTGFGPDGSEIKPGAFGHLQTDKTNIQNLQDAFREVDDLIEKGGVRPIASDLPPTAAGSTSAPVSAWGVTDIFGQEAVDLANEVYQDSVEREELLNDISRYKGGGKSVDFSKWTREVYAPLMLAAAKELGMGLNPFFSLVASRPGFKYIEHRIAKRDDLKWYWEMQGDPNVPWEVKANHISNLRLLLNDRYKQLKDAVEVQIYGGSKGTGGINQDIPNRANRYIVDIEAPSTGRKYSSMDQNPGDIVIKKAGSNQEVGRIGEYYSVLWSSFEDLTKNPALITYFSGQYDIRYRGNHRPDWRGMNKGQLKDAIREWRNLIISDHLDIIRRKENDLVNLTPQQKLEKINIALYDDMVDFRDEFMNILPHLSTGEWAQLYKDMSYEAILELQRGTNYVPKPAVPSSIEGILGKDR